MLTAVERVLILKGADLLKEVGPRHLLRLAEVAREVEMWKGDTIYKEDDLADALYMMVEGRVRISTGEEATSEVGPGEAFGTWALVDDSDRGHRVECTEDGLALALDRAEFYEVAAGDLALLQEVVRALAKRLRAVVSEHPEEARIEGEGIEKPEALEEAESQAAAGAAAKEAATGITPPSTAGATLEAAAVGKTEPPAVAAEPPSEPAKPAVAAGAIPVPDPIVPVEPPAP